MSVPCFFALELVIPPRPTTVIVLYQVGHLTLPLRHPGMVLDIKSWNVLALFGFLRFYRLEACRPL